MQRLNDENMDVRNWAIIALGRMGESAQEAVPSLIVTVLTDVAVRKSAVEALGNIGLHAESAVPTLIKILSYENEEVRKSTVKALGQIGKRSLTAVTIIIRTLHGDSNEIVRMSAAQVLGQIVIPIEDIVPALVVSLAESSIKVRSAAAASLERIGVEAVPFLIEALNDTTVIVRENTVHILGRIGIPPNQIVPALVQSSRDGELTYQNRVIDALEMIDSKMINHPAVSFLIRSLTDADARNREHAVYLLGAIGEPVDEITAALIQLLNDEEAAVSIAAEKAVRMVHLSQLLLFSVDLTFQRDLNHADTISSIPEKLRQEFQKKGIQLSLGARVLVEEPGSRWLIVEEDKYAVRKEFEFFPEGTLNIYRMADRDWLDRKMAEWKEHGAEVDY